MPLYIAVYKPFGMLSQFTPESGHPTLADLGLPPGVYPAGRLDRDSEGLLLLTDDGPFIKRLLDPHYAHPRSYLAQVEGTPTPEAVETLRTGVDLRIDGKSFRTRPCGAVVLSEEPDLPPRDPPIRVRAAIPTAWLCLTLTEGKNRQVRRMTAAVGLPTLRLVRVAMGGLRLEALGLAPGAWCAVARSDVLPPPRKRVR